LSLLCSMSICRTTGSFTNLNFFANYALTISTPNASIHTFNKCSSIHSSCATEYLWDPSGSIGWPLRTRRHCIIFHRSKPCPCPSQILQDGRIFCGRWPSVLSPVSFASASKRRTICTEVTRTYSRHYPVLWWIQLLVLSKLNAVSRHTVLHSCRHHQSCRNRCVCTHVLLGPEGISKASCFMSL